ncbi:hypothetical protein AB0J68_16340 [Micromonospora sp. NPDC049580]|uniref:hypothetical protein n=1 Tax=Micromonospora sp. NPDC049580 TaxID=3154832 RepID=UPI003442E26C
MANAPGRSTPDQLRRVNNRLWLNSPYLAPALGKIKFTLLAAAVIYTPGLVASFALGFGRTYLVSPAFILGAVGTGWVAGSIRTQARSIDQLYDGLSTSFGIPRSMYLKLLRENFDRIFNWRGHVLFAAAIWLELLVAAYISFFKHPLYVNGELQSSLRPWVFTVDWYSREHIFFKFGVILYFAAWIGCALGVTLWLFIQDLRLLRALSELPVPPVPESLRARLRSIADFHVGVAVDWSIGAILFVIMFSKTPDYLSIAVILMLILAGSAILVYPQLLFARIIRNSHERSCRMAIAIYARSRKATHRITDEQRLQILTGLAEISVRPRFWVYSANELVQWSLAQAVAIAALAAQIYSNR